MEKLNFSKISIYDYKDDFYKWHESQIREKFISACSNDSTLSKEFKKHVSNPENVQVQLYPQYGYDIFLSLSSVYVDYSYDYTFTCSTGATITGELKYNSYSNSYEASNVNVSKNYSSSDYTHKGNTAFYSTKYENCLVHLGTAKFNKADLKNYKNVEGNSTMPSELRALSEKTIGYSDINQQLKVSSLPEEVQAKLKKHALEFAVGTNQRNFRFHKITDYFIEESSLTFLPSGCLFVISTTYKDKVYTSGTIKEISDIKSFGEQSNHYSDFEKDLETALEKFSPKKWASNAIYLFTCLLTGGLSLALFIMLVGCKAFGHEGLNYQSVGVESGELGLYKSHLIIFIIFLIVLFFISIFKKTKKVAITAKLSLYTPTQSSATLRTKIENYYKNERNEYVKKSVIYLIIISILCSGIIGYTAHVWNQTDNPNYWYTPEIINTYIYHEDNLTSEWIIEECDNAGNVSAIFSRNYFKKFGGPWGAKGWYCQKAKYSGKIIEKENDKVIIEFVFVEMLEYHELGYPREEFTIELKENCTKLYDEIETHKIKDS